MLAYYNAVNEYTVDREQPAGRGYADCGVEVWEIGGGGA